MVSESSCPSAAELDRALLGPPPRPDAEPFLLHLERCDACLAAARLRLTEQDLLALVGRHGPPGRAGRLVARCRGAAEVAGGPGTVSEANTPRPAPAPEGDADSRAFLGPPQLPGEIGRLGPYRVRRVLGAGGMGIVCEAEDTQLLRPVALKVMKPALAASDTDRLRFLKEARATAAVRHAHVVTIYAVGEDRGVPFLAMELLEGETLEQRLGRTPVLPPAEAARVGRQIAEGLAAAHDRGLIHRDVKPANVWLEGTGAHVKLLDFGLARALADDAHLTRPGTVVGTPAYMAPEQARGEAVDHRCDLFSLGAVLYRMLTGERPFRGRDLLATLRALEMDTPPPPHAVNPAVPRSLSALVMRLLAKRPSARPPTAHAAAQELADQGKALTAPPRPPPRPRGRGAAAPGGRRDGGLVARPRAVPRRDGAARHRGRSSPSGRGGGSEVSGEGAAGAAPGAGAIGAARGASLPGP